MSGNKDPNKQRQKHTAAKAGVHTVGYFERGER